VTDQATVLAVFAGVPYFVATNAGMGEVRSAWVPFEIRYAVDVCAIPIIAAYTGCSAVVDPAALSFLWPQALAVRIRNGTARVIRVPFKQQPLTDAVSQFSHNNYPKSGLSLYSANAHRQWGLLAPTPLPALGLLGLGRTQPPPPRPSGLLLPRVPPYRPSPPRTSPPPLSPLESLLRAALRPATPAPPPASTDAARWLAELLKGWPSGR
jgi:hypothetical protein